MRDDLGGRWARTDVFALARVPWPLWDRAVGLRAKATVPTMEREATRAAAVRASCPCP